MDTPPSLHRTQKHLQKKLQEGVILSYTVVQSPSMGFADSPRNIGLIQLNDGTTVLGQLLLHPHTSSRSTLIGKSVYPRMRNMRINKQGLRIYDVAYEVMSNKPVRTSFPGYIIALTGPSGVGKTTVSHLLAKTMGEHAQRVPILTTRAAKKEDTDEYQYISTEEFLSLKNTGQLAAYTTIPSSSEKRWYGYRAKDIEHIWNNGKIPIVITEMHLLQGLSSYFGRRSIVSFGLLPPGKSKRQMLSALLHRLRSRGRDTEKQIADRLKNAEEDLQFFDAQKDLFDHLIINDELDTVIEVVSGAALAYVPSKS